MQYHYNAFISYSHSADGKLAPAIQSALHRLAKPWYKIRALWVFRDETSLAASPELWPSIEKGLRNADYFLFLASPNAAQSFWVQKEVQWWLDNRSIDKFLIVLTDGQLSWNNGINDFDWNQSDAIPIILKAKFQGEPLYVDFRWAKTEANLSLRHLQFRACILDLAAPIHGVPKEDLDGEDIRQYRKTRRLARAVTTAIGVLAIAAGIAAYIAFKQQIHAQLSNNYALNSLSDTSFNANKQLEGIMAGIKAVNQLEELNTGLNGFIQGLFPSRSWLDAKAMTIATLHQALFKIHEGNRLEGHSDIVNRVIFSPVCPNGKQLIASASNDKTVKLWQFDGTPIMTKTPLNHTNNVTAVSFSPDCQNLASADGQTTQLWKLDGALLQKFIENSDVKSIDFSPNGQYMATANHDGQITFWNPKNGLKIQTVQAHDAEIKKIAFKVCPNKKPLFLSVSSSLKYPVKLWHVNYPLQLQQLVSIHQPEVNNASFNPDCTIIATASSNHLINLWKLDGTLLKTFPDHGGPVNDIVFSPDAKMLVSAGENDWSINPNGENNTIKLWDLEGIEITNFRGHEGPVTSVEFASNGNTIISGSADNTIRLWNIKNSSVVTTLQRASAHASVLSMDFSPDANILCTIRDIDHRIVLWDMKNGTHKILGNEDNLFMNVAISSNSKVFAWDKKNDTISIWDSQGEKIDVLPGQQKNVSILAASPDAKHLVLAFDDKTLGLWRLDNKIYSTLGGHKEQITSIAFNPKNDTFVTASKDNVIKMWNHNSKDNREITGYSNSNHTIQFSPDGQTLAFLESGKKENIVKLWHIEKNITDELKSHDQPVTSLSFGPDGKLLASSGLDKTVRLWNLESKSSKIIQDNTEVNNVIFSPDNTMLATVSNGDKIKLWGMNGVNLTTLQQNFQGNFWGIRFSEDSTKLMAIHQSNRVKIWNLDLSQLKQLGCQWVNSYLKTNIHVHEEDKNICSD